MNTEISYAEGHKQQLESTERHVGVAQEPENLTRPKAEAIGPDEFPVRVVPRVEIVLGAVLNTVNDVVEQHKVLTPIIYNEAGQAEPAGQPVSLFRPLSRPNNGAAIEPLEQLYTFLQEMAVDRYLIVADEVTMQARVAHLVNCIDAQLKASFGGNAYEQQGLEFSIARSDYFAASVADYRTRETDTVNTIQLVIRVNIHAASLTSAPTEPAEAIKHFDLSYRQVVKNFATATGIKTTLATAFDVSNFTVRPNLLVLFGILCNEPGASAKAVNTQDHIHDANVMVSVALKNPNAKTEKKVKAKTK